MYDLLVTNAKTRASPDRLVDIAIAGGRIVDMGPPLDGKASAVIDAEGRLVTEAFVNGHLHLDKVYTLERAGGEALAAYQGGTMGAAMTAIELAARVKEQYDESWITPNVERALRLAVKFGCSFIRAFADVDTKAKLVGVKALIKAREAFSDRVMLQIVAFPQDGIVRDPGAEDYVREALALGADVVGGIPWIEYTDDDAREHIDRMFALAVRYDKDLSMLVDDAGDPGLRTLEMLSIATLRNGWQGRVTVQHARAMQLYPEPYYRKIEALLAKARIGVVSDPHTGPLHARVRDLAAAGVPVALGQDDIADAYYPFGRNNMLEVAFLAAHLLWMTSPPDLEALYDMITTGAAAALGIRGRTLEVGSVADLVVLDAESVAEALSSHEPPLHVIKNGREVTIRG